MSDSDERPVTLVGCTFNYKALRDETRRMKCCMHGADSPDITASQEPNFIKFESEPLLDADPGSRSNAD
jgi:hypothetical protein